MPKNDLDVLLPEHELTVNGEKIIIRPFSFAKMPQVISLLSKIGVGIFDLFNPVNGLKETESGISFNDVFLAKLSEVVEAHFSDVAELMGIYCNKPKEYFLEEESGLSGEDGLVVLLTIVERNYGFFIKRLRPILAQIREKGKSTGKK